MMRAFSLWRTATIVLAATLLVACGARGPRFEIEQGTILARSMHVPGETNASDYEEATELATWELLPEDLKRGETWRVGKKALTLGPLLLYTIQSDEGEYSALGTAMLRRRIAEIEALPKLRELGSNSQYKSAAIDSALDPLDGIKEIVTDPAGTAKDMVKGAGLAIDSTKISYLSGKSDTEDSYMESLFTVSKYKREIAAEVGIDVYTDNEAAKEELDRIGYAASEGGWTPAVLTAPIGGLAARSIKTVGFVDSVGTYVVQLSPGTIRHLVDEDLKKLGITADTRYTFMAHPHISPRQIIVMTQSLNEMEEVGNLETVLKLACQVRSIEEALFFQQLLEMQARYHREQEPLSRLQLVNELPVGISTSGNIAVMLPVDYVRWTSYTNSTATKLDTLRQTVAEDGTVTLFNTGEFSHMASDKLEALDFVLVPSLDGELKLLY